MAPRYWLLIFLFLFAGCSESPEKPKVLIEEETYISLLVELQLVRSYSETERMDEATADSLRDRIFQEYEVSDTVFWANHEYYQQFPEDQKKRVEKAIEALRMDQTDNRNRDQKRREEEPD